MARSPQKPAPNEVDWLRPHIEALFAFCQLEDQSQVPPKKILNVFATPERPYAQAVQEVMRRNGLEKLGQLPLPATALTLMDVAFDSTRYTYGRMRKVGYTVERNHIFRIPWPQPWNLLFQFDLRTRWQGGTSQMWQLMQQFQSRFDHAETHVDVDLGTLGVKHVRLEVEGPQDNSDLEPQDNKERALRRTWSITLFGWLPAEQLRVPSVRTISTEVRLLPTDEEIQTITVAED